VWWGGGVGGRGRTGYWQLAWTTHLKRMEGPGVAELPGELGRAGWLLWRGGSVTA